jgi:hypothetical protein
MTVSDDTLSELDIRSQTIVMYCVNWFSHQDTRSLCFLHVLQRKLGYSLRVIDWMVTNFSKRFPITIVHNGSPIDVHNDYERHLAVFNKRFYDPFARRKKINLLVLGTSIDTTVGQLNFFRWFVERNLHDVVKVYLEHIESDMRKRSKRHNGNKEEQGTTDNVTVHRGQFSVGF